MLKKERQLQIMKQINLHNRALSSDLGILLNVSEDTIRRDLNELAQKGKLVKVHGGAISKSYHFQHTDTETYAIHEKIQIGQKAVSLIRNHMYIIIGGGTTVSALIRQIPTDMHLTLFTASLTTALQLCEHTKANVVFLGGTIAKNSQISVGGEVINKLSEIHADLCILGTNGIHPEIGITDSDIEAVQVKKAMIKASKETAILTISEKLNSVERLKVCNIFETNYLITELNPNDPNLIPYQGGSLKVL